MIAVDTNLLLHAHRADSPLHDATTTRLAELAVPGRSLGRAFTSSSPSPRTRASLPRRRPSRTRCSLSRVGARSVRSLLHEEDGYWDILAHLLRTSQVTGPKVHDARIATLCILHAVTELWTADRDLSRFAGLKTRNPLVD